MFDKKKSTDFFINVPYAKKSCIKREFCYLVFWQREEFL